MALSYNLVIDKTLFPILMTHFFKVVNIQVGNNIINKKNYGYPILMDSVGYNPTAEDVNFDQK